jgi:hypothetical protein
MGALDTGLPLYAMVFGSVYAMLALRFTRTTRRGDEDWRTRWRALAPAHRRSILATMRRGDPVTDADDAELGPRAVAQSDFVRRAMRPMEAFSVPSTVALLAFGIVAGDAVIVAIGATTLIFLGVTSTVSTWSRRRLHAGAATTRRWFDAAER